MHEITHSPPHDIQHISTTRFNRLHLEHVLEHPPDHVLFPFLHGLEGDNDAQNMFFASSSDPRNRLHQAKLNHVSVPKYRGLVWVVCDDDLDPDTTRTLESDGDSSEDDEFDDDESYDDSETFSPRVVPMDIDDTDIRIIHEDSGAEMAIPGVGAQDNEKHMHPVVHHRPIPLAPNPDVTALPVSYSSTLSSSSSSSDTSASASPQPHSANSSLGSSAVKKKHQHRDPLSPPLLTSTFHPKELLRKVPSSSPDLEEWEFVPVRVPEGISLRNFGIQVPIYATLSDIVVYSPKGASPNVVRLASRFRSAITRKRAERIARRASVLPSSNPTAGADGGQEGTHDVGFEYNVFVLDADEEAMRRDLPHLMVRLCGALEGGGASMSAHAHAHTSGTDGRVVELDEVEGMEMGEGGGRDVEMGDAPGADKAEDVLTIPNTVDFAQREKEEMRDLTRASEIITLVPLGGEGEAGEGKGKGAKEWDPMVGQVFLGNSNDVPVSQGGPSATRGWGARRAPEADPDDPFNYLPTNDPAQGLGFDICVECHEMAPFPSVAHLRASEEHLRMLEEMWAERGGEAVRPPPNANAVVHLPFPSSPPGSAATMAALMPVVRFLERWLQPVTAPPAPAPEPPKESAATLATPTAPGSGARRWSSVGAHAPSFPPFPASATPPPAPTSPPRTRSFTSPAPSTPHLVHSQLPSPPTNGAGSGTRRTRPLKILIYSSDGYTESSVPALCLLMAVRGLALPEAYLELQVEKKRSFFVYQGDLGVLKRVELRLKEEAREKDREREGGVGQSNGVRGAGAGARQSLGTGAGYGGGSGPGGGFGTHQNPYAQLPPPARATPPPRNNSQGGMGRPAAKSVSFAHPQQRPQQQPMLQTLPMVVPSQGRLGTEVAAVGAGGTSSSYGGSASQDQLAPSPLAGAASLTAMKGRPRASTSPWLPSLFGGDHQSWFNDPRFDGSFPSRVLPFLYLGNLNHATNAYMLHALGITHVVSVGECALVPPPHHMNGHGNGYMASSCHRPSPGAHFVAGKGPGGQGSLWIEEREGRIKVLDIKGVCDDGIDTLEPQLEPICDWIDKARQEGGQVLVHCRVGVSRSATVTIAYVMKHLGLPLVDAYLIVRSRRLSVLIQPNMRLLYNLCGWEIKLAKERAGADERRLKRELARTLSWPYLAKEVHALNEKYLH